jgi:hypothetical protein
MIMTNQLAHIARSAILLAFALLLAPPCSADRSKSAERPNVVLILADDLGFSDPASYGSEISTPNLDELAERGLRFTNYHTAASCAPTRGMLLTGVDSHRNGVPNIPEAIPPVQAKNAHYRGTLNHNVVTIASLLRDAGRMRSHYRAGPTFNSRQPRGPEGRRQVGFRTSYQQFRVHRELG